jgi:hypothetical protein
MPDELAAEKGAGSDAVSTLSNYLAIRDRLGTGGCGRQDDCWRRVQKFGTVVFAHAEDVEPNAIGHFDLFEKIGHAIRRRRRFARPRIGENCCKTVDANFHSVPLGDCFCGEASPLEKSKP